MQGEAAGPTLRRQTSTTVTVEEPTGPTACSSTDHDPAIRSGFELAMQWLSSAVGHLDTHIQNSTGLAFGGSVASPDFAVSLPTRALEALQRHFRSTSVDTATIVRDRLRQIQTKLSTRSGLQVECHRSPEGDCHANGAFVIGQRVVLCPSYFEDEDFQRAETLIHEFAHALVGGPHIDDRAYRDDRSYDLLSTAEALRNADSYALLAQEIATRQAVGSTAPRDARTDCPSDWQPLIRTAIARGQRWNRNAQVATSDLRPEWIADIAPTVTSAFGAATADVRSAALTTYDRVYDRLRRESMSFECEADAAADRCRTSETYWYFIGRLHLCPSWRNLPNDEARIRSMLTGLYGWIGGEDDDTRRLQLANFAGAITPRYEPV